ncbi:MAG TPA: PHP domain-containing protein [Candidatus Limnocylindria bacterium]|nr:PHP domain-containing protein [Candidatus Limnocylindria bacterium]
MSGPDGYCELHAHSNFSFLDGASHVEDLVAQAALLDMPGLAITDHGGLYAAVRLWQACRQTDTAAAREAGLTPVRPIIGVELTIPRDGAELAAARRGRRLNDAHRGARASRGWPGELHAGPIPGDHLVVLARNAAGYSALSRLVSRGQLAGEKQFPVFERRVVETALAEARGHVIGLTGCRNGEVPRRLLAGERRVALDAARRWAGHFADGDFCVELSHHLGPDDDWIVAELAALAEEVGLPTVVSNEVHYAEAGGHRLQDVLVCIRHGATLDEARELLLPNAERRLKDGRELAAVGADLPDATARRAWAEGIARAAEIGRGCRLDLDFERYRFPGFPEPGGETPFSYLYQLAHEGLRQRYRPITRRALAQLAHELDIIDRTNLSEFFLIVWDLMEFARRNGIIGQGRGSAGDSIVAYCLGITKVDPIEHKLLFERFINEARVLPDIDIDFDVNRREEVIQYLYGRYGANHAAMVCTLVTYRARSAVREVAKALGFPAEAVDALAKALDTRDASDVARDLALDGSFGWLFEELDVGMAELAVPPGRDGRRATGSGTSAPHVVEVRDSPWHERPRRTLEPAAAGAVEPDASPGAVEPDASPRAVEPDASPGAVEPGRGHERPVSEGGWYPPRRPRVLDASVTSVKHEATQTKRYARLGEPAAEALRIPGPRDNGSPGPSSGRPQLVAIPPADDRVPEDGAAAPGRPRLVRIDPESGMPVEERRRQAVVPSTGSARPEAVGIWQERTPADAAAADAAAADAAGRQDASPNAPRRNRWQWLLTLCAEIDGFPRHLGIHVGGMVVTRTPLIDLVPIERATMPGRVVTQYDKEDIEQLGLVKIDLLSLRTLGVVSDALNRIERDTGHRPDLDALPHDDPEVFRSIQRADTVGMFQIESRAQMQALPKSRPERFEDLVVQVAIIRPGPIQGNAVHPYLRRRTGQEPVTYLHDSLRPILEDTLGVILYQEQVMQIAIEVCGYTALEADIFRKAMGSHRSHREMEKEHARFVAGAMRTGLTAENAEELFRSCSAFAEFGFARAHAAAFAKISYDTAWLKLRYPAHYYAGVLNNQPMGFYSPAVVVNDAKRHGTRVLPVDVNASAFDHDTQRIADSGDAARDFALRLGLRQVKGIDEAARETFERERAIGPYTGVRDFVARTRSGEQVVERLISVGAFDWTGAPRRELLWQLRTVMVDADPAHPALGMTDDAVAGLGRRLPPMTFGERVAAEYRELGLASTAHAVELFRDRLAARGVVPVARAGELHHGASVRLAGLAVSVQHPMTAKNFVFVALEDESGMINVTLGPAVYQAHRALLHRHPLLVIDGRLQVEGEVLNVVARRLRSVDDVVGETPRRPDRLDLARQQRMFR